MKKILIINGHPDKEGFCFALAESYKKGADTNGDQCQLVHLIDLKFNPIRVTSTNCVKTHNLRKNKTRDGKTRI